MTRDFTEHDALIVRSLQGTATPSEARFLASLLASPEFRRYHDEVARLWALTSSERSRRLAPMPVRSDVERQRTLRRLTGEFPVVRIRRTRQWLAAASVVITLVGGAALLDRQGGLPFLDSSTTADYRTRDTETMTVTLDDGSLAHLAPHSHLRVVRSRHRRGVQLEGRAFFAVHRTSRAPFVIYTTRGRVEARRGRFDIQTTNGETRVLVVDGDVTMEASGGRVRTAASHMVRATLSSVTADTVADVAPRLAWMHGFLVFRDTPLRTVAREIGQLYDVRVDLDSAIADRTVTAWFSQQSLRDVLSVISRATYTSYDLKDGVARLASPPPGALAWPRTAAGS
jgi:ferric-dicitrate binding protein FerR (iron transport regulator)